MLQNKKAIEELLREQLELLAERSKGCIDEMLPSISSAMVEIHRELNPTNYSNQFLSDFGNKTVDAISEGVIESLSSCGRSLES